MHWLLQDRRVRILAFVLLLALALALWRGLHFGIEFEGGTRIPVALERPVKDAAEMQSIVETIKTRVTKFGLAQVVVRGVGASEVYVEVPQSDQKLVEEIGKILKEVGRFEGIVDGRVAITGAEILRSSIQTQAGDVQWQVSFAITTQGAKRFGEAVLGKANYPLYMFLDRPEDAVVVAKPEEIFGDSVLPESEIISSLNEALRKGNESIQVFIVQDWNDTRAALQKGERTNRTQAVVSDSFGPEVYSDLEALGFKVVRKTGGEMKPSFTSGSSNRFVSEWPAVGLLSAPTLNPSITQGGTPGLQYQISGAASGSTPAEKLKSAQEDTKRLKSILSGGELPTNILVGSVTTIPAPLGAEFLRYSVVGAVGSLLAIGLLVVLRYREPKLILPIMATSFIDMIILVAIIGGFGTIDLSAMAGIIAAVGVSVDAQIVVTDELLKKGKLTTTLSGVAGAHRKMERAFEIIRNNMIVAVVAMVPLLFSGLVEIMGFATATILGSILGIALTRPAYGAVIEHMFGVKEEEKGVQAGASA